MGQRSGAAGRTGLTAVRAGAVGVIAMVLAGCAIGGGDAPSAQGEGDEAAPVQAVADGTGGERAASAEPEAETEAAASAEQAPEPEAEARSTGEIELEERHPDGVLLRVTEVTAHPTHLKVAIEAVNGSDRHVELSGGMRDSLVLADDLGGEYALVPPEGNQRLKIDAAERLDGRLTFAGELDSRARTLRLTSNAHTDLDGGFRMPRIVVDDIPAPGAAR